jgi:hypothetical protein
MYYQYLCKKVPRWRQLIWECSVYYSFKRKESLLSDADIGAFFLPDFSRILNKLLLSVKGY